MICNLDQDQGTRPVSLARFLHRSKAFCMPFNSMEHFPALRRTSPLSSRVMEQCLKAQTALMSAFEDDNTFDFAGEDTHGLEESPNCPSPPLPSVITSFLLQDSIIV